MIIMKGLYKTWIRDFNADSRAQDISFIGDLKKS